MLGAFERVENGETRNYKKLVLALLQQCKDEGLTVDQTLFVLSAAGSHVRQTIRNSPLEI